MDEPLVSFQKVISLNPYADQIYQIIRNTQDKGDLVLKVLEISKDSKNIPECNKSEKSEEKSTAARKKGSRAFNSKSYQTALKLYNEALLMAPKNSLSMILAYNNRSALFLKVKQFQACIKDINICLELDCSNEIRLKLRKRKREALKLAMTLNTEKPIPLISDIFKMNVKLNPQIPSVTADVGIMIEAQIPKIVAVTDIKVGQVVAVEKPFVSTLNVNNMKISCYYCAKMSLNLIPCDNCCVALFCDEMCMKQCNEEYHNIECQMMELVANIYLGPLARLNFAALLKFKNQCQTWAEFITASKNLGMKRVKKSTINSIYDIANLDSTLCFFNERQFVYNQLFNVSFGCGFVIHYLDKIPGFMPEDPKERLEAKRAVGRILVHYSMHAKHVELPSCVNHVVENRLACHEFSNYALYSFASKVKASCTPNLITIALHDKVALVALSPINKGTELTLSYITHWLDCEWNMKSRQVQMFAMFGKLCDCTVCTGQYKEEGETCILTEEQRQCYNQFEQINNCLPLNNINYKVLYENACKTLQVLHNVPYSKEYAAAFKELRYCLFLMQDAEAPNITLDHSEQDNSLQPDNIVECAKSSE